MALSYGDLHELGDTDDVDTFLGQVATGDCDRLDSLVHRAWADGLNLSDLVNDVNYTLPGFGSPGLYYEGKATELALKSKAPGLFKDALFINGVPYTLPTSKLTRITSNDMTVRLCNTKRNKQGKAVGKWIIELESEVAILTFE